jgi:putative transposase
VTDSNVFKLAQPGTFGDLLTEVLRNGARSLLVQAVEAEVADFLAQHADLKTVGVASASCATAICRSARS